MTTVNETSSTEQRGLISKPPENKPSRKKWPRAVFTWVMWLLGILSNLGRGIKAIKRLFDWLREMSDAS